MNRTIIRSALAGMRDEVTCSLCTGYLVDPHSLGCSHTFCRTCVLQELAENSRCPTCKLPMAPKELRPHTLIANILPCVEGLQPLRAATERPRASRRRRSKAAAAESAPRAGATPSSIRGATPKIQREKSGSRILGGSDMGC